MNYKDLQLSLTEKTDLPIEKVDALIQALTKAMVEEMKKNKSVGISGFGSFLIKKQEQRITVNPITKKRVVTPPKLVLAFHPSSLYKEKLKNTSYEE